jgi:hypothetical protein
VGSEEPVNLRLSARANAAKITAGFLKDWAYLKHLMQLLDVIEMKCRPI